MRGEAMTQSIARYRFMAGRAKSPCVRSRMAATFSRWYGLDRLSAWPITSRVAMP